MEPTTRTVTITRSQERFASWMTDVLVYIIVLNLFVEFVDEIVIDSFVISILTAILLKALLDPVIAVEHRLKTWRLAQTSQVLRALGLVGTFLILFCSKLLILEVVNIVFGDHVSLGHFVEILALIISMMAARALVGRTYHRLGVQLDEPAPQAV